MEDGRIELHLEGVEGIVGWLVVGDGGSKGARSVRRKVTRHG